MQSSCSMFWSFVDLASRLFYFPVQQTRKNQTAAAGYLRSRERPGAAPSSVSGPGRAAAPAVVPQPPRPQQVGPGRRAGRFAARHRGAFREPLCDASAGLFIVR